MNTLRTRATSAQVERNAALANQLVNVTFRVVAGPPDAPEFVTVRILRDRLERFGITEEPS
jgi:hypothetical protein